MFTYAMAVFVVVVVAAVVFVVVKDLKDKNRRRKLNLIELFRGLVKVNIIWSDVR